MRFSDLDPMKLVIYYVCCTNIKGCRLRCCSTAAACFEGALDGMGRLSAPENLLCFNSVFYGFNNILEKILILAYNIGRIRRNLK